MSSELLSKEILQLRSLIHSTGRQEESMGARGCVFDALDQEARRILFIGDAIRRSDCWAGSLTVLAASRSVRRCIRRKPTHFPKTSRCSPLTKDQVYNMMLQYPARSWLANSRFASLPRRVADYLATEVYERSRHHRSRPAGRRGLTPRQRSAKRCQVLISKRSAIGDDLLSNHTQRR